jgi:hypothetical protein
MMNWILNLNLRHWHMTKLNKIFITLCCLITTAYEASANANMRDPTRPIVKDPTGLDIQGISETEGFYYCLINNRIYEVGDKISDFKISKIEFEKVFFEDQDGKTTEILL